MPAYAKIPFVATRRPAHRRGQCVDSFRYFLTAFALGCASLLTAQKIISQVPGPQTNRQYAGGLNVGPENMFVYASVEVEVHGTDGALVAGSVHVSLIKNDGKVFATAMARTGKVRFDHVPKTELTAQVIASGYDTATKKFEVMDQGEVKVKVDLRPMADKEAAAADRGIASLNSKAQKDIGKALEALRANRPAGARVDLEAAQRHAPNSAEVAYLFGIYASQVNDITGARSYWMRALELNPSHLRALLALSQDLLHERKTEQAEAYLQRALDIEPSSWRAHMLLAQADLLNRKNADAVKEAQRAIELGHDAAVSVQPLLAHALFETGEKDHAIQTLQAYTTAHPADANATHLLERLKAPPAATTSSMGNSTPGAPPAADGTEIAADFSLSLPVNWLPPDVDEKVPPVEPGAVCVPNDVLQKAGEELANLVRDMDRFTATETLVHESINRYGIAAAPEKRKFDYVVSIQDLRPGSGLLSVTEYRNSGGALAEFPDGIVTKGLPALVLIFHPYYAADYEMTCEGLARINNAVAWQIHFRQRPDKPNTIKSYQLGIKGPSYPVALKGRAWISADSYQIIRMETDIVAPVPQISLMAEHTAIEYGPVKFRQGTVTLWLPQSAEVYFARGKHRIHRRHSFSNYLLFKIDEKDRIADPKESGRIPPT